MRPAGSPQVLQQRRERALALLQDGYPPCDVASMLKVDRRSVRRWNAAYRQQGPKALQARPAPGRPPKLAARDKARLEKTLLKGAVATGFATDLWTCPRIAVAIAKQFGVHYHVDHIGRLMRALGWSPQKPARRAVERDEQAIANWVKSTWPGVKKTPRV
ncbi:MAG: IS630 family transposase [Burkholderiales bacterium]